MEITAACVTDVCARPYNTTTGRTGICDDCAARAGDDQAAGLHTTPNLDCRDC